MEKFRDTLYSIYVCLLLIYIYTASLSFCDAYIYMYEKISSAETRDEFFIADYGEEDLCVPRRNEMVYIYNIMGTVGFVRIPLLEALYFLHTRHQCGILVEKRIHFTLVLS